MSPAYIYFVVAHTLASVKAQENFYPCNIHTDYTPTVWAPTYSATSAYPEPTTTTPTDGSIVLVAGASPHQGYVMVNYDGGYGAILSCTTDFCNRFGGSGAWSCSEAEVVCHQLGYIGAESYSVDNNWGDNDLTGYEKYRLKNVLCRGDEASLFDCSFEEHSGFVSSDNRIAGVSCIDEALPSTTTWEPSTSSPSDSTTSTSAPSFCPSGWLNAGNLGCFLLQENFTVNSW